MRLAASSGIVFVALGVPTGGVELFVAYGVVALVTARVLRWDLRTTVLALAVSVPPLATLWFDRWATRTGRLPLPEAAPTS